MSRALPAVLLLAACTSAPPPPVADLIFHGGPVVTLDAGGSRAEALAVAGRRIVAVGSRAEVMRCRGPETWVVDLGGRALLPGFVEAHGVLLRRADAEPEVVAAASAALARVGLTTIQEGAASPAEVHLVTAVANELRLEVDALLFPRYEGIAELGEELEDMDCVGSCRIGGVALAAGGPLPEAELRRQVRHCLQNGWHLHATVRSPAELAALLDAVRGAAEVRPSPSPRIVALVHCAGLDAGQLEAMAELGLIASFSASSEPPSVGLCARAAAVPGLRFTLHDAADDRLPDPLGSIAAAVRAGLDPERAVRCWTSEAAHQVRLDGRKGSLEVGKLADLVILSADPTAAADPGGIAVLATLAGGRTVFAAD